MKKNILIILLLILFVPANPQELRCRVSVVSPKIQGTNKQVFQTLQNAIYEFMNNRRWTNHIFDDQERIECNLLLNITQKISVDEFKGTLQIQSKRPVYNSSYNTTILNFKDNEIHFKYVEFEPLEFNEQRFISNLTSILAYYAYIIIGLDYDTFSPEGGTIFFEKAENIVSNAQICNMKGWKAFESRRNRYWLVKDLLHNKYKPLRQCLYKYHRIGLDLMAEKVNKGRAAVLEGLELLKKVYEQEPAAFLLQVFFDAKADEIVNIFSEAYPDEKNRIINLLNKINPSNASKYQKIVKN